MSVFGSSKGKPPVHLAVPKGQNLARYLLTGRNDVLFYLRALEREGRIITASYNQGRAMFVTKIIKIRELDNDIYFDFTHRSIEAKPGPYIQQRVVMMSSHQRVHIQFSVEGGLELMNSDLNGRPVLRGRLPHTLLRLQRREHLRLIVPENEPLTCHVTINGQPYALGLLDISGGGVSLLAPLDIPKPEIGEILKGSHITIQDSGTIYVDIKVIHMLELILPNGTTVRRIGCAFERLDRHMELLVQHYISRLERGLHSVT
jgi:flagellar brake protein